MKTSPPPGTYTLVYPRAAVQLHCYLAYTAVPCKKSSLKKEDQTVINQMEPENREHGVHQVVDSTLLNGFADDHSLNKGFWPDHVEEVSMISELEGTLANINSWMGENRLKMNNSKTEFLYIASCHQLQKCEIKEISVCGENVPGSDFI